MGGYDDVGLNLGPKIQIENCRRFGMLKILELGLLMTVSVIGSNITMRPVPIEIKKCQSDVSPTDKSPGMSVGPTKHPENMSPRPTWRVGREDIVRRKTVEDLLSFLDTTIAYHSLQS